MDVGEAHLILRMVTVTEETGCRIELAIAYVMLDGGDVVADTPFDM